MSIPFIQPAFKAVRQWADLGGNRTEDPQQNPFRKTRKSFDEAYPRISNPLKLSDHQKLDLMSRLGFSSVTNNEVDLGLSRTPADTDHVNVANHVKAIISHFRAEHPDDSETAAARELLKGSSALSDIDSRLAAARSAQDQAEAEQREFEKAYHEFRSLPAKYEQLTSRVASLEFERNRLTVTDFDAKIRQLIEIELNPKPGLIVSESVPNLLLQRDTRKLRLEVIDELTSRMNEELEKLSADNKRLAQTLDLQEHKL
jgi:hypothetical protein